LTDWLYAIGIPVVILFTAAIGKKLIRSTPFEAKDWFLGVDASLTAITTGLASVAQFLKADPKKVSVCLVTAFLAYVINLVIHQENEPRGGHVLTTTNKIFLGFVSNFIGFGALATILLLLK